MLSQSWFKKIGDLESINNRCVKCEYVPTKLANPKYVCPTRCGKLEISKMPKARDMHILPPQIPQLILTN